jgi:hypothetical protein
MSSCGGSGCGGVTIVSWGSTPHIPAVTTKENISYLTKKKRRKYLALRKWWLLSFAPSRGWVWVAQCQPPLLTIVHPLNHKEKHLVSKEKQKTKQRNVPASQTTVTVIRACSWMRVGCVTLATIADNGSYPKAQRNAFR